MPASLTPDQPSGRSFGTRCAQRAFDAGLIDYNGAGKIAVIIDEERAALKARAAAGSPVDHSDPRLSPATPEKVDGKKFGDAKKIPPTPEQVEAYGAAIGYPLNGQDFFDSYDSKGWKVGKVKMKNWQAAVRNWKSNGWGKLIGPKQAPGGPKDFSKF